MVGGLLKKDFRNLTLFFIINGCIYLILFIVSIFLFLSLKDVENDVNQSFSGLDLAIVSVIMPSSALLSSYQFDDKANWEKFIIANGAKREHIFLSKLLLIIIFTLFCSIFTLAGSLLQTSLNWTISINIFLTTISVSLFSCALNQLIAIYLGAIKGNLFFALIMMVSGFLTGFLTVLLSLNNLTEIQKWIVGISVNLGILLISAVIYLINKFSLDKKDY